MTLENLQKKWWYRLIKVLYITVFVFTFWVPTVTIFSSYKPYLDTYNSKYQLKCIDGALRGNFDGSKVVSYSNDFYDDGIKNMARYACHYISLSGDDLIAVMHDEGVFKPYVKNYDIVIKEGVYEGSWSIAIGGGLVALLGTIFFLSLIRAIFFYIAVERNFWKTLFFKQR
jgi:hypothetical protein